MTNTAPCNGRPLPGFGFGDGGGGGGRGGWAEVGKDLTCNGPSAVSLGRSHSHLGPSPQALSMHAALACDWAPCITGTLEDFKEVVGGEVSDLRKAETTGISTPDLFFSILPFSPISFPIFSFCPIGFLVVSLCPFLFSRFLYLSRFRFVVFFKMFQLVCLDF